MTHEFRTPVNSILALTTLLAERLQTPPEQKDEVFYIRKSAQQLVRAGRRPARPRQGRSRQDRGAPGAVRGREPVRRAARHAAAAAGRTSRWRSSSRSRTICRRSVSDESKVSQILRNFISNALKYTERGEVRVSRAADAATRDAVEFAVADTGIGIPAADLDRIFDEFVQIENPLQRRVKGTGLGLPLSKRLAELLGGAIERQSTLGVGSTFSVTIPLVLPRTSTSRRRARIEPGRDAGAGRRGRRRGPAALRAGAAARGFRCVPARSVAAAMTALDVMRPAAIVLDIRLHGEESWDLLTRLKRESEPRDSGHRRLVDRRSAEGLRARRRRLRASSRSIATSCSATLESLVAGPNARACWSSTTRRRRGSSCARCSTTREHVLIEAATGRDGLRRAQRLLPDVILLDLRLTDMTGVDVCEAAARGAATRPVPVILVTSQRLSETSANGSGRIASCCRRRR